MSTSNHTKKVYLIYGEEHYLVLQDEQQIINEVLPSRDMDMMNHGLHKDGATAADIAADCDMLPFMAERRLVRVRYSGFFVSGQKEETDRMAAYIESIPDTTVLLFIEEKADSRNALYKAVKKYGECIEYKRLRPKDLKDFIKKQSKNLIKDPEYFISVVGTDMASIVGEIKKALIYTNGAPVTNADIDNICTRTDETKIGDILNAIGKRDIATALGIYHSMLRSGDGNPLGVLKMLANRFKLLLECKVLAQRGMGSEAAAEQLSAHEFAVRTCMAQSRQFTSRALLNALNRCYKCEHDIKNGLVPMELGVELIIMEMNEQ